MATSKINQPLGTMDLLWSNSNPHAEFAAQTVSVNMQPYKYAIIEFLAASDSSWRQSVHVVAFGGNGIATLALATSYFRRFYVTGTQVQFYDTYVFNTYGSWQQTASNTTLIPQKIYGVK